VKQIPSSTDRNENSQSSAELRAEVEQLSNIATNQKFGDRLYRRI